ncbi:MAG: histidine phosphatase family protein [Bacteroidota bacterium]
MTRFLLVRHAATDAIGKWLSGRANGVHLNDAGRIQAQELAQQLSALKLAAVYTSPLDRAIETAAPIASLQQVNAIEDEAFNEMDFGSWTNLPFEVLNELPAFRLFNSVRSLTRIPGGEMMAEAQARFIAGMQKLTSTYIGKTIAIVSHADLIRSVILFYAGIPLDLFHRIEISTASVSTIELYAETARITGVNYKGKLII